MSAILDFLLEESENMINVETRGHGFMVEIKLTFRLCVFNIKYFCNFVLGLNNVSISVF